MIKRAILYCLVLIFSLIFVLFLVRLLSHSELDDASPIIQCDDELIQKADVFWIIPRFENSSMEDYPEWVSKIKGMNKTLGLHGVYHSYNEFLVERDEKYLQIGIDDFEKVFGYKPRTFKAPQLALSKGNRIMIENQGLIVKGELNQIMHKVYHCNNTGEAPNWFIKLV